VLIFYGRRLTLGLVTAEKQKDGMAGNDIEYSPNFKKIINH